MEPERAKDDLDLEKLVVNLAGLSDQEIEQKGRDLFNRLYMTTNQRGIHKAHDGEAVYFWKRRFDHAFYEPTNWRESGTKTVIAKARVARIKWIAEMIAGKVPDSECWLIPEPGNPSKRLYVSFAKGYLVWLEPYNEGWKFSTAYNARREKIRTYTKRMGAKRI